MRSVKSRPPPGGLHHWYVCFFAIRATLTCIVGRWYKLGRATGSRQLNLTLFRRALQDQPPSPMTLTLHRRCKDCGSDFDRPEADICHACASSSPPSPRCEVCYRVLGEDGVCRTCSRGPRCKSCFSAVPHSIASTTECLNCYEFDGQAEKCDRCSRNFKATDGCLARCWGCKMDRFQVEMRQLAAEEVSYSICVSFDE